jgi:hypothetical protein
VLGLLELPESLLPESELPPESLLSGPCQLSELPRSAVRETPDADEGEAAEKESAADAPAAADV